ncbi:MAG: hypothetical protein AAF571_14940 [Verrucomicrobiota bacterium]
MLKEKNVSFAAPDQDFWFNRIFLDTDHLLSVTYNRDKHIACFHFVMGLRWDNKTWLSWDEKFGIQYSLVDSGESSPLANRSPVATGTIKLDPDEFWQSFYDVAHEIDPEVITFIKSKIFKSAGTSTA